MISLRGLTGVGYHGVLESERLHGQPFVVDVDLFLERFDPSDDLSRTVDYAAVADDVALLISGEPASLIETVADRIAEACLAREPVTRVRVVVHKPSAPVRARVADVCVTIERP